MPLPLELDLPATDRLDHESERPPGGESSSSPDAVDAADRAAEMVEGPAARDDGPDLDVYERHGEPQRAEDEPADGPADHEPSESERKIRIILARDVEDASCGFKGLKGQEFDGVVSSEGDVYIDTEQGTVGLEAEEFEEVRQEEAPADANAPADDAPASKPAATAIQEAAKPKSKPKSLSSSGYTVTVVSLAAHQRQVADVSAEIATTAVEWATAQEEAKAAKKRFDEKVEELRNLVARGPEAMPLFDMVDTPNAKYTTAIAVPNALDKDSTPADTAATTAPVETPVSEEESYERLLDATPLSSLTLIKDGKKASLKGSLQKLADAGVNSIWDWERLRADVAAGKATYPPRIRKDDMEEAVSQWVATNWTGRRVEIQAGKGGPAAGAPQADPDPIFPDLTEAHDLALREFQPLALGLLKPAHDRITAAGISNLTELADAIWDRDNPEDSGKPCWEKWTPDQGEYQTVRRAFCRWCADNLEAAVQAGQTGQQTDQPASEATTAPTTAPAAEPTLDDI